eukprot:COSAG06_NODE_7545_length_2463_cov_18.871585_3_plen_235_part_01
MSVKLNRKGSTQNALWLVWPGETEAAQRVANRLKQEQQQEEEDDGKAKAAAGVVGGAGQAAAQQERGMAVGETQSSSMRWQDDEVDDPRFSTMNYDYEVRQRYFLRLFYIEMIILPRQARDKHRESTQKRVPFSCRTPRQQSLCGQRRRRGMRWRRMLRGRQQRKKKPRGWMLPRLTAGSRSRRSAGAPPRLPQPLPAAVQTPTAAQSTYPRSRCAFDFIVCYSIFLRRDIAGDV